jgi:putative polyketide hydroxylase
MYTAASKSQDKLSDERHEGFHMSEREIDVLVVGAGPAGLTVAGMLARYGVDVAVIERKRRLSDHQRATVVSTRQMELLRSWGLEDEMRAGGDPDIEFKGLVTETLAAADRGQAVPVGLPTKDQAAVLSPTASLCVPQDYTEAVLLRYVRSLGVEVTFGCELVRVDMGETGGEALVRRGERTEVIRASYVIGADGAHSLVRSALGIEMNGPGEVGNSSTGVQFTAPLWELVGEHRYGIYPIVHPDVPGIFVASGQGDRWVFGTDTDLMEEVSEAELTRLIRIAAGVPDLEPAIQRISTFTFTALIADRYSDGRGYLIGDAAHRVTPRGGTGMNTAMADGRDLGWKLGWVLSGWAGPELLDSYEEDRRPAAAHNVARSADPDGSYRDTIDEIHIDLGGRIPHLWVDRGGERVSTLDLVGEGLTLFSGPDGTTDDIPRSGVPIAHERLPAMTARSLGISPGGSLLVRPDHVPVLRGASAEVTDAVSVA